MIAAGPEAALPRLRKPPLRRYLLMVVLVPFVFVLIALWVSREQSAAEQATAAARQSYQRRLALTELVSSMKDAETGQRGYVITGDRAFLEPYLGAREAASDWLADLSAAYRDDPLALRELAKLDAAVRAKFAEMARVLRLRDSLGRIVAEGSIAGGNGRRLMDRIRSITTTMEAAEDLALERRQTLVRERVRAIRNTIALLLGGVAISLCAGLFLAWRADRGRYRSECEGREASARLRAIFDSTLDALVILNPSGTIESMNAAATTLLGYTPEELSRTDVSVVLDIAEGEGSFRQRIGLVGGRVAEPRRIDRVAHRKDGGSVAVDIALGVMQLPDGAHVVAALRDATERKAIERMKDEFISTVSHELRTPLTSVVGALGLLRGGGSGELTEAARRLVEIAESNSRRLIRLINDMLDIEKIGSGRMRFDMASIEVGQLVARAVTSSEGLAAARGVTLVTAPHVRDLLVSGDAERLMQVMSNLLSNAIRFSPPGGTVRINVDAHDGQAIVTIDDEGPGVPVEFRNRIFARFSQAGGSGEPAGGSGLGLAISREIVRAHDGKIWFGDAPSGGARFGFSLRLLAEHAQAAVSNKPRILLCEADGETAAAMRAMLSDVGHEIDCVHSFDDIVQAAEKQHYAALLLHIHDPDSCGIDIIPALRDHHTTRDLPIIVVSGGDAGALDKSTRPEIVEWLTKPVTADRLTLAVQAAIRQSDSVRPTLLHIDDDRDLLEIVAAALDGHARLLKATSLASAQAVLTIETPDIVILDLGLPDGSGADLLPRLVDRRGTAIPTIIYSAQDVPEEIEAQVQAVLVKSRKSLPHLAKTIRGILTRVPHEKPE
jgi:PAS domain S-box-containing protein